MKVINHLALFLIGLTLFSCQNSGQKTIKKKLISYRQILQGVWIPNDYIKEIKRTKSPIESSKILWGYSEIIIDTNKISGDSLYVAYGWNNHEGDGFYMWFKQGQTNTSYPTSKHDYGKESNFYELGYEINRTDTSLVLYYFNQDKKNLSKSYFSKVSVIDSTLAEGLQYFVNSVLIAGKYKLSGNDQTVEFTNSGQVRGLDNFQNYYIQTDFVVRADNNLDNIIFNLYSKTTKQFAYKIKKDTLEFYTTTSDSMGLPIMTIDNLQFRLVRQ